MLEINIKISTLRALFHSQLSPLYDAREINAIFFLYAENKYDIKKHQYFLNSSHRVDFEHADIELLVQGCPIQYVIGKTTFFGLPIYVNRSVLIPRQETEELTEMVLNNHRGFNKIIDIGTGSGAIAIALAKNIENAEVWATDFSETALETAQKNALLNKVRINFLLHNIFTDDTIKLPDNVNIIVSNPPYIPQSERFFLHKNVVQYEPATALFVSDENPLLFYISIANIAKNILCTGGYLYFEVHENFQKNVSEILAKDGFKEIMLWNDLNGKPRFVSCKKL